MVLICEKIDHIFHISSFDNCYSKCSAARLDLGNKHTKKLQNVVKRESLKKILLNRCPVLVDFTHSVSPVWFRIHTFFGFLCNVRPSSAVYFFINMIIMIFSNISTADGILDWDSTKEPFNVFGIFTVEVHDGSAVTSVSLFFFLFETEGVVFFCW